MLITCSVAVCACSNSVEDSSRTDTVKPAADRVQQVAENDTESATEPAKNPAAQIAESSLEKNIKNDSKVVPTPVLERSSVPAGPLVKDCIKTCEMVMDQRGQVTDQCPRECKENPSRYSENDLVDEDTNMGLLVLEGCYKPCVGSSADRVVQAKCSQKCCVSSCMLRSEYNGGGYARECPAMCREFLKKKAKQ
jgi:hypothetical protein